MEQGAVVNKNTRMNRVQTSRLAKAEPAGERDSGVPPSRLGRYAKDGGGQSCWRHGCREVPVAARPHARASGSFLSHLIFDQLTD
jgi:hypothetical protein